MQEMLDGIDKRLRADSKKQQQRVSQLFDEQVNINARLSALEAACSEPLTAATADVMRQQLQTQVQQELRDQVHKASADLTAQQSAQLGSLMSEWQVGAAAKKHAWPINLTSYPQAAA